MERLIRLGIGPLEPLRVGRGTLFLITLLLALPAASSAAQEKGRRVEVRPHDAESAGNRPRARSRRGRRSRARSQSSEAATGQSSHSENVGSDSARSTSSIPMRFNGLGYHSFGRNSGLAPLGRSSLAPMGRSSLAPAGRSSLSPMGRLPLSRGPSRAPLSSLGGLPESTGRVHGLGSSLQAALGSESALGLALPTTNSSAPAAGLLWEAEHPVRRETRTGPREAQIIRDSLVREARSALGRGSYDLTLRLLRRGRQIAEGEGFSAEAEALDLEALTRFVLGQYPEAAALWVEAEPVAARGEAWPRSPALLLSGPEEFEARLADLRQFCADHPDDSEALFVRLHLARRRGEFSRAAQHLARLQEIDPSYPLLKQVEQDLMARLGRKGGQERPPDRD